MDLDSFRQSDNGAKASTCHRLLIKLAEACKTLPSSLNIEGIEEVEREPSACGGFADIFRGSFRAQIVALKRLRLMQATADDRLKIRKVSPTLHFTPTLFTMHIGLADVFSGSSYLEAAPTSACSALPWS